MKWIRVPPGLWEAGGLGTRGTATRWEGGFPLCAFLAFGPLNIMNVKNIIFILANDLEFTRKNKLLGIDKFMKRMPFPVGY